MDRLSAGTFFVLLSDARKDMLSASKNFKGNRSGITEVELLTKLALIANPNLIITEWDIKNNRTLQNNVNDLKTGKNWGGTTFRLHDKETIAIFKERFHHAYKDLVSEMAELVDTFINDKKDAVLVKALMEVIVNDNGIFANQNFNIGWIVTKNTINKASNVELPSFLLGIWYYVITEVEDNKIGQETYERWCPSNNQGKRMYQGTIGENSKIEITITRPTLPRSHKTENISVPNNLQQKKQNDILLPNKVSITQYAINDIPFDNADKALLQKFNSDYDELIVKCIGNEYAMAWISDNISQKIVSLYENKWKTLSADFQNLSLHSDILGLLDMLQKLCDNLDPNTKNRNITAFTPSVREIRHRIRNYYIKLHPYEYVGLFPYESTISDWIEQ